MTATVLDFNRNRDQIIHDLTDFAEALILDNGRLESDVARRDILIRLIDGHNTSLQGRLAYWRGKAIYTFIGGLLLGSGAIAYSTLDVWQILDRAFRAVGL